jgi:hypothetical protein
VCRNWCTAHGVCLLLRLGPDLKWGSDCRLGRSRTRRRARRSPMIGGRARLPLFRLTLCLLRRVIPGWCPDCKSPMLIPDVSTRGTPASAPAKAYRCLACGGRCGKLDGTWRALPPDSVPRRQYLLRSTNQKGAAGPMLVRSGHTGFASLVTSPVCWKQQSTPKPAGGRH